MTMSDEAIERAKEHFSKILEEQLERVERMKKGEEWTDYSSLEPIIIGIVGDVKPKKVIKLATNNTIRRGFKKNYCVV